MTTFEGCEIKRTPEGELTSSTKEELRARAQMDQLFLGRMLGYNRILDRVHAPVAQLGVAKNPSYSIEEQDSLKERLHLDPRGTFKSTFSIIDSVQWIICFPDVRICKLTATKPLATAIAGEITGHFVKGPSPTLFQEAFEEFCIAPRDRRVGEFTAPCRKRDWREATVMAFSIETSISGWHFDVEDPDDLVDTVNSSTPQGIAKVKANWRVNRKTLMPWGYVNYKGTRYKGNDLWADTIERAQLGKIKLLIRAALLLKSGRRLEPGEFPPETEMELLFPELLSYDFLRDAFEDDYGSFMTQYMNDAHGSQEVIYSKELMLQQTLPARELPATGEVVIRWRLPYGGKPYMKYACGAVGVLSNNRLFVSDVVRGQSSPSNLAHRIVQQAKNYGTHKVAIEQTPGAEYYTDPIQNYALVCGWPIEISWLEFQEDDGAREQRMKRPEASLIARRLFFSDALPAATMRELTRQFTQLGAVEDNEIVDVVSRLDECLPRSIALETSPEQDLQWELVKARDLHDRTYGLGRYAPVEPVEEERYQPQGNQSGLEDWMPGLNG